MTNIILNIYQCIMFVFCRYAIVKTNDSEESYVIALDRKEELEKIFQTELHVVGSIEGM